MIVLKNVFYDLKMCLSYKNITFMHLILGLDENSAQHNALYDAEITMKLHKKIILDGAYDRAFNINQ